jgi:hypothetical protein
MTTVVELASHVHHIWTQGSFQTELDDAPQQVVRANALVGIKATLEAALQSELDAHYLLHYLAAPAENAEHWRSLFQALLARGLNPQAVELLVSDGANGVVEAMTQHLPQAKLQRCVVHKARGMERYLRYRDLPQTDTQTGQPLTDSVARQQHGHQIKADALAIFDAPHNQKPNSAWRPLKASGRRSNPPPCIISSRDSHAVSVFISSPLTCIP